VPATAASSGGESVALPEMTDVKLLLDYFPYGAHAGIYMALENGYYEDNNISLEVITPNDPVASLKFVQAGQADIGIAHPIDVVSLVAQDSEYESFMSLVGGNLEGLAILGSSGITSAKDLEGKKVGTSGSASHNAMVTAQIEGAGGDPSLVEFVTVGSSFMQYLVDGQVDAVAAFKPDVAAAQAAGEDVEFLPVGVEGGLAFPSVIVYANEGTVTDNSEMIRAFVDATIKGYEDMLADPAAAAQATVSRNDGLDADSMQSQIEGIGDSFIGPNPTFGYIDPEALQSLADFMLANEFITTGVTAEDFVTTDFVPGS
jgi:putative hydroxymethylpyrimidine transport system substrate-binding protein